MRIHFLQPLALLLLFALPLLWWAGRRLRSISPGRRWASRLLRSAIVVLLALALAQPQLTRRSRELTVFYVLDESDSVPSEQRRLAYRTVQQTAERMRTHDRAGIIVFGGDPSIEDSPVPRIEFTGNIRSDVVRNRTHIASALRLALAAFPPDTMKRIVLFSDGNENEGAALDVARMARGSHVPIDVVPLRYRDRQDVQITKLVAPQQSNLDAPFDLKVIVEGREDTPATLRLYENDELVAEQAVQVRGGRKNVFVMPRRLAQGGFHTYRAVIEAPGDTRPENNVGYAYTYVKSRPRALCIEGDETGTNYLVPALRAQEIEVDLGLTSDIPQSLDQLQNYDTVILSNVPASAMSNSQMRMIERAVHTLGIGLVMVGGENAFGAGGYQDTPIETALPVSMDIKQKRVLPNGALVIVLHTCEIPQGNTWAREISIAALNVLSARDYFGLAYWGAPMGSAAAGWGGPGWGEHWAWDPGLQLAGDKRRMRSIIRGIAPSDMPTFDPTLEMAYKALKEVKAEAKHIVVISDGDPAPPRQELANAIREEGITISTVVIAPHFAGSAETMRYLAYWGGGNFYYPKSSSELPRIFVKEATTIRRSLIAERTFLPNYRQYSEILTGIRAAPALHGHVVSSLKDLATLALDNGEDDPVLAHWRYGLGKTVAFTSDAKNKWARDWVGWDEYAKFWAQLVRWSMRETSSSNHTLQTDIEGGQGTVVIDALTDQGQFENFLEFEGNVVTPDLKSLPIAVRQIAPGRYSATFPATEVGTYMVSLRSEKGEETQLLVGGAALSYSPEYQVSRSNDALLQRLADESGGVLVETPATYNPFVRDLPTGMKPRSLWPLLAMLGLLLLPVDIFLRRVYIDWSEILAWFAARWGRVAAAVGRRRAQAEDARMAALKGAKARAAGGAAGTTPETPGETAADGASAASRGPGVPATPAFDPRQEKQRAAARQALRETLDQRAQTQDDRSAAPRFDPNAREAHDPAGTKADGSRDDDSAPPGAPSAPTGEGGLAGGLLDAKRRARRKFR